MFLKCMIQYREIIVFPSLLIISFPLLHSLYSPHIHTQIVHGGVQTVNFLCDAPSVRAISFVGGNQAGEHIHDRGTKNGKRVQVN